MYSLCSISLSRMRLFGIGRVITQFGHPVDHVRDQMEAVHIVAHDHVERRRRSAFFFVAAHVQIVMIGTPIGQAVNQPGIAVIGEDDRFVGGEERVEILSGQAMRMFLGG